jgi:acetylornithine/succinyldiaminopimelate/putrescine aminotransferase
MVGYIANFVRAGLERIQVSNPDFFTGIRQNGVIMGLEFNHPEGAKPVMKHLYRNGVWAIFSALDPRVLQFKPGVLMSQSLCEELLRRVDVAIAQARQEIMGASLRKSA